MSDDFLTEAEFRALIQLAHGNGWTPEQIANEITMLWEPFWKFPNLIPREFQERLQELFSKPPERK